MKELEPRGSDYWERMARGRLERNVQSAVKALRDAADEIEREAAVKIKAAAERDNRGRVATYSRVAEFVTKTSVSTLTRLGLENIVDAASEADEGRVQALEEGHGY